MNSLFLKQSEEIRLPSFYEDIERLKKSKFVAL